MRASGRRHILTLLAAAAAAFWASGCAMRDAPALMTYQMAVRPDQASGSTLVQMKGRTAFEEGVALVSESKYAEAEKKFFSVLEWYEATGDELRIAETTFWLGFCFERQGRVAEARELYEHLQEAYPQTPAARQAANRLSRLPPLAPEGAKKP